MAAVVRTELGELRMVQATHPTHRRVSSELMVRVCV